MKTHAFVASLNKVILIPLLALCLALPTLHAADKPANKADKPANTLAGVVKDEKGKPLAGATAFIFTAAPKKGTSLLCPSCYPDCTKKGVSDATGNFTIEALDPTLKFEVLIVAKGYQPQFASKVDPSAAPVNVVLKARTETPWADRVVHAKVVNSIGRPVAGAVVNLRGVTRDQGTRFGGNRDLDQMAVTDEAGKFMIAGTQPFDAVGVDVEARGLAKGVFHKLTTGDKVHELQLNRGVSVTGRLMKDGKPVSNVQVGISGAERSSEVYVGNFSVGTDDDGRFLLVNMPAKTEFWLYGAMKSLKTKGSVPAQRIRTEEAESTLDVGDVKVAKALVLEGKITRTDGKAVPAKTKVSLGREEAWDTQQVDADAQGHFKFTGVPPESINVYARLSGLELTVRNASLDPLNPYHLIGRLASSKTNLVLEFEPGSRRDRIEGDQRALYQEPLRGAEGGGDRTGDIQVAGLVTDAETGKPLEKFSVVEGRRDQYRQDFNWMHSRKTEQSNGTFTVYFVKQQQPPGVLIEAEGYLPQASPTISGTTTNLTFALKKGQGPHGIVKRVDGKAAAGVTVYLPDARNGVYVEGKKGVREEINKTTKTKTDDAGKFSFAPSLEATAVVIVDEAGFAQVRVEDLAKNPDVQLQAYGRVEGVLKIGAKPGAKESVRLGKAFLPYEFSGGGFAPMNLYINTTTDENGKFVFERVPPVNIEVYHEPKVRDSQMGLIAQSQTTKFQLNPGETKELTLGGRGRPIIGKMVVTGYQGTIDWRADVQSIESVVDDPPGLPTFTTLSKEYSAAMTAAKTDEEKATAREDYKRKSEEMQKKTGAFYQTEAGRQHYFQHVRYALNFKPDGTFRIEDVPGGKYTMRLNVREGGGDGPARFSAPTLAALNRDITVPEAPGGRSDEPFDLGTVELTARNSLKAGKAPPNFEVKSLEGKPIKLSDFKGKYVLLDFWAVWCGPCVAETPNLKETYEAFKNDPRFAMIGLSLDPAEATPREYARTNQLGWIHGFLGEWSKTQIPTQFGVEGIPSIFLIGPDGKVIESGLRGPRIKSAVQSALSRSAAAK